MVASANYILVTDEKAVYRLNRKFKIPKGLKEIPYLNNEKVYDRDGKLLNKFMSFGEIEPRFNPKKLVLAINYILTKGLMYAN